MVAKKDDMPPDPDVCKFLLSMAADAMERAEDQIEGRKDPDIDWDYVAKQIAYAQMKLNAASMMATMRATAMGK